MNWNGNFERWNDLFPDDDMENVVMDSHDAYQAWNGGINTA